MENLDDDRLPRHSQAANRMKAIPTRTAAMILGTQLTQLSHL
jgi:hypothetical protein